MNHEMPHEPTPQEKAEIEAGVAVIARIKDLLGMRPDHFIDPVRIAIILSNVLGTMLSTVEDRQRRLRLRQRIDREVDEVIDILDGCSREQRRQLRN